MSIEQGGGFWGSIKQIFKPQKKSSLEAVRALKGEEERQALAVGDKTRPFVDTDNKNDILEEKSPKKVESQNQAA